jgi:trans-aconitate methyltransferase
MTSQTWEPGTYDRHARFVSELGKPVVEWLGPQPGERILDLGCGDGALTLKLQDLGCQIIGVDSSPAFVNAAQNRGLDARLMDAQALSFDQAFDAVFSNAALHWMTDPDRVIAGVYRALKPGGRFVAEMGGAGNVDQILTAIAQVLAQYGLDAQVYNPWYFPTIADYRERLAAAGFQNIRLDLIPRPTLLPTDIHGWLQTFAQAFLTPLPSEDHAACLTAIAASLKPHLCDSAGQWFADYVRLRFMAWKMS